MREHRHDHIPPLRYTANVKCSVYLLCGIDMMMLEITFKTDKLMCILLLEKGTQALARGCLNKQIKTIDYTNVKTILPARRETISGR